MTKMKQKYFVLQMLYFHFTNTTAQNLVYNYTHFADVVFSLSVHSEGYFQQKKISVNCSTSNLLRKSPSLLRIPPCLLTDSYFGHSFFAFL